MNAGDISAVGTSVRSVTRSTPLRTKVLPRGSRDSRDTERIGAGSATIEPPSPIPLEFLWHTEVDQPGLWLALDQIQDPQNLGALFRLAGFFGVRGIVLTKDTAHR